MSGGWSPVIHLACHKGEKPVWDAERACFLPPIIDAGLYGGRRRRRRLRPVGMPGGWREAGAARRRAGSARR